MSETNTQVSLPLPEQTCVICDYCGFKDHRVRAERAKTEYCSGQATYATNSTLPTVGQLHGNTHTQAMDGTSWLVITAVSSLLLLCNETIKYHFKFVMFIICSLVAATLPVPLMLPRPGDARNALIPAWGCRMFSEILGMSCIVRGTENIKKNTGCVVLINHQSAMDLRVLAELWPLMDRCTQVAKKSLFYLWPFGLACWLWGTIFIDRVNPEEAQEKLNRTERAIKYKKARLLMFPEGTRGDGNELLPFKKGAFHVAVAAQCPIQPVVVSKYHFLNAEQKYFGRGTAIISILPMIPTVGLTKHDIPGLVEKVRHAMGEVFSVTSQEALQYNDNIYIDSKKK